MKSFGWMGLINEIKENSQEIVEKLIKNFEKENISIDKGQILAWRDSLDFLVKHLPEDYKDIYICLEYILPRMDSRRPDILLFLDKKIIILEFKMKDKPKIKDILQAIHYRQDILKYHRETWQEGYEIACYLVLTKSSKIYENIYGLDILTEKTFRETMKNSYVRPMPGEKIKRWVKSIFEPLPEMIQGTIELFQNGKLPDIKNIREGDLYKTESIITDLIEKRSGKKQILLLTGVPGAGKTLLALKTTYRNNQNGVETIYLSGNGPLISILQEELGNKAKITGILNYVKEYYNKKIIPPEEIIVFDEAQRAWDAERMSGGKYSEVEALLEIGNSVYRDKKSITIIAMIGHGQEIHKGEEKGIKLWMEELRKPEYSDWEVFLPVELKKYFKLLKNIWFKKELFIDTSIRSDFLDMTAFKDAFLKVNLEKLKENVYLLYQGGYELYWTDNLKDVTQYQNSKNKVQSCIIGSSGVESNTYKKIFSRDINSFLDAKNAHSWYKSKNDNTIATEFTIQGLDIDYPVVVFGGDYYLSQNRWVVGRGRSLENKKKIFHDVNKLMKNIYNILLTRGRKGMLLFLPEEIIELAELKNFLIQAGIVEYKKN